ncbi:MAG TPA: hypothetical protein VNV65_00105 [Candidatus Solibacter sp.]|nr:hypothetical protein [Candidatus Solibacter sp.]
MRSARLAAVAALATGGIAIAQPVSTSAAAPLAAAITCSTTLTPFPGSGSSSCNGSATGVANGAAAVLTPFTSNFTYSEPCPPVLGSASGSYSAGAASGTFTWTRVGLTAVLLLHPNGGIVGAAAALFLPLGATAASLTPPCSPAATVSATVVAVGAGA